MKLGELLLLLAVAGSQVDQVYLFPSLETGLHDFDECPITYFGKSFTKIDLALSPNAKMCFKNNEGDPFDNCVTVESTAVEVSEGFIQTLQQTEELRNSIDDPSVMSHITAPTTCSNYINPARKFSARFYNFSQQSLLQFSIGPNFPAMSIINITATAGGELVRSWSFNRGDQFTYHNLDLSSCRSSGVVVQPDVTQAVPNCAIVTCDQHSNINNTVSTCAADEFCLSNSCHKKRPIMCTVSGFTVIDFHHRVHSVPDRCDYTLVSGSDGGPHGSGFFLEATFRERRRKDVPFLDSLRLNVSGVQIYLEQGGRVSIHGSLLELNSTAQLVHGVELSKDLTGVTAKFNNLALFFDGNTAHVMALTGDEVEGLCGKGSDSTWTTNPVQQRNSIANRCDVQHNDTFDSTIDCDGSTARCELMRHGDFTACHSEVDPEPYITACTNTTCKYPDKDGVDCQFFEAYVKSCSLKNITLSGWRSSVSCPVPAASCLDQHCSSHEFCGERSGEPRCFCRALFASHYKANNSFGQNTVCKQNSASVTLYGCLLEDLGINHTMLHLKDKNCTGVWDQTDHVLTFSFSGTHTCGTEVMTNNTEIIYKNSIMSVNSSAVITRHDQFRVDFSCYYTSPPVESMPFRIKNSNVVQKIVSGIWNYTLMMNAYTDSGRTDLIGSNTELVLNQRIWVELKTEDLDGSMMTIVTQSCWATSSPSPNSTLHYDLVTNGCANTADGTVKMVGNGVGTSNYFSFNMFQFSGEDADLYLHCEVKLCPTQSGSCDPGCGSRRRRSFRGRFVDGKPALITMVWGR